LQDTAFSLHEKTLRGEQPTGTSRLAHDTMQASANTMISRLERDGLARAFDPSTILCDPDSCPYMRGHKFHYFDDNHITVEANRLFVGALERLLTSRAPSPGITGCAGC